MYCRRQIGLIVGMWIYSLISLASCGSGVAAPPSPLTAEPLRPLPSAATTAEVAPLTPTPVVAQQSVPQDWSLRWLKGIPCRPPCWEGITPGQTGAKEAVVLLRHNSIVATVTMTVSPLLPDFGELDWDGADGGAGGLAHYHAQTDSQTIFYLHPTLSSFHLHEIMQSYGEPSHIIAKADQDPHTGNVSYFLMVIYLPQGFALTQDSSIKPVISTDMLLAGPSFFIPTRKGFIDAFSWTAANPEWPTPWQGFKGFDFYCWDGEDGQICHTTK